MKKRLLSLLLALSMMLSLFPATAIAATKKDTSDMSKEEKTDLLKNPFWDVGAESWCYDAVQYARINGFFNGTSAVSFTPNGTMTRGMFVAVLGRIAGIDPANYAGEPAFSDVPANKYYAPYVAWATKYGITLGVDEDHFNPNAMINRQQMAAFLVRYCDAFDVKLESDANITSVPADLDTVSDYAKDAVLRLWKTGMLNGDGTNFNPKGNASRAQAATLFMRTDKAVGTWYTEPGVPSTRESIDPEELGEEPEEKPEEKPVIVPSKKRTVTFYDGNRKIATKSTTKGNPLSQMPTVEEYSKAGAVLEGYYLDEAFTEPFYADTVIAKNMNVYAKYQEMDTQESLTVTTFTQMDCKTAPVFVIESVDGTVVDDTTVTLETKDGSEVVPLSFASEEGATTVSVSGDFIPGCSYELHLADGLIFAEKPETIRTASFSMYRAEEEKLQLSDDVTYIEDTDGTDGTVAMNYEVGGASYAVLTSALVTTAGGSFNYGSSLTVGEIVCIYVGTDPRERSAVGTNDDGGLLDPAVYVKIVADNGDGTYDFAPLGAEDQLSLYELPDNFPMLVESEGDIGSGTVSIELLDVSMYENMMGSELGTLEMAKSKINVGDFVTLYCGEIDEEDPKLYFGKIKTYDPENGYITYVKSSEEEILGSMDLYANIDLSGEDLISEEEAAAIEAATESQLMESDFPMEAAYLLADLAVKSDGFSGNETMESLMLTDDSGAPVSNEEIQLMGLNGFELKNVSVSAKIIRKGSDLHFKGGVQMRIGLEAQFDVPTGSSGERVAFWLRASFIEEVSISPGVKGELTTKKILGIPIPNGVKVDAHVDILNFTSFDFDAEIYTVSGNGKYTSQGKVADTLDRVTDIAESKGINKEYEAALQELMDRYSEMVNKETDWITLMEKELFTTEVNAYGLAIGIETDFVVRADMSLAIGSELEYEVGKRYSFWFKIGLYTPSAGSDTMDLIDEEFAFRFYVMGKMGVRAGIKAKLYAGIGSGKVASVGIAAEMGPYIKLWGFFIYEYSKHRDANASAGTVSSKMGGALAMEFGLYFILSFEAEALGLFEYNYDFLNKEIPLLEAGSTRYCYDFVDPEPDEVIILRDEDADSGNGITMPLPSIVRTMKSINLRTGAQGFSIPGALSFSVKFSSPHFSYNGSRIKVNPPSGVNYVECDMTVTYRGGKQPLTNYDMSVTIPLVWTNLANSELKEYKMVSVIVTDGDNYEKVWSKKVLAGQEFDLPSVEEIKALCNWSDLKYSDGTGYNVSQTEKITVREDKDFYFDVDFKEYSITVSRIQNADGSLSSRTYTTYYGESFDFSDLEDTGANVRDPQCVDSNFTRFTEVTTTMQAETAMQRNDQGVYEMGWETIDLTAPITGKVAETLKNGGTAQANYADNSVTAVFTFNGVNLPDISLKLRQGDDPALYNEKVAEAVAAVGIDSATGLPLAVKSFEPALGPIEVSTTYTANCVEFTGKRADVSFDLQIPTCEMCQQCGGVATPNPINKLVGSLLFNLPALEERRGYKFDGWFTAPEGDEDAAAAATVTVPENGITLYAHWTPKEIAVSFDTDGGTITNGISDTRTVVYDTTYGLVNGMEMQLPEVDRNGYYFLGWYTEPGDAGTPVDESTAVAAVANVTLYAHWRKLIEIPQDYIDWKNMKKVEYQYYNTKAADPNFDSSVKIKFNSAKYEGYPTDGFVVEYKIQGATDDLYNEWYTSPKNEKPGVYDIRITRPADDTYAAFDVRSSDVEIEGENWFGKPTVERLDPLLEIEKGDRPASCYDGLWVKVITAMSTGGLFVTGDIIYGVTSGGTITEQDGATVQVILSYGGINETKNLGFSGAEYEENGVIKLPLPPTPVGGWENDTLTYTKYQLAVEVSATEFWRRDWVYFGAESITKNINQLLPKGTYTFYHGDNSTFERA